MNLSKQYIEKVNKTYKDNIKRVCKLRKTTLAKLSKDLGHTSNYVSNACNKTYNILSNNLLHKISKILECSLSELSKDI